MVVCGEEWLSAVGSGCLQSGVVVCGTEYRVVVCGTELLSSVGSGYLW